MLMTTTENIFAPTPDRRVKRGWMNLRVAHVIHETPDTDTFLMVDAEEGIRAFDYIAGQYLTFRFDDVADKPIVRSYTMSSSPCQPDTVAFTVKRVEKGLISNWLCDNVRTGSILRARGPIGRFCYDPANDKKHLFMIAAGSGVTPFVSIMRDHVSRLGQKGSPDKMTLLVSYRSTKDLICWEDLNALRNIPGCRVIVSLSREHAEKEGFLYGRINENMIAESIADAASGDYGNITFMSCGPQEMMDLGRAHALSKGVVPDQFKTESFES